MYRFNTNHEIDKNQLTELCQMFMHNCSILNNEFDKDEFEVYVKFIITNYGSEWRMNQANKRLYADSLDNAKIILESIDYLGAK